VLDKVGNSGNSTLNKYNTRFSLMAVASRRRSIVKTLSYRAVVTVILSEVTLYLQKTYIM
jgi:hypothetical protein